MGLHGGGIMGAKTTHPMQLMAWKLQSPTFKITIMVINSPNTQP
jgi:hypothetical protein